MNKSSGKYEIKKEQIIDAAEDLFAYYGYHKTTLDDIARKIGIKKNSIYYYFESKEELLNAIIANIYKIKVEQFEKRAAKSKTALNKLKAFLSVLTSQKYSDSKKYNITPTAFLEISRVIDESFYNFFEEAKKMVIDILNEGIKKGELRKHNTKNSADTILEFARSLEFLEYTRSNTKFISRETQKNLENRLMHFVDLIYYGIKK